MMKTLFIILKATTGITLVSPTILSVTSNLQKHNVGETSQTMEQVVTAGQAFMDSNLLNRGSTNFEKFSNFKKISSPGNVMNDVTTETGGNGAPYDRFGGGLFLDNSNYSSSSKSGLGNNLFGTYNYVSDKPTDPAGKKLKDDKSVPTDVSAYKTISSDTSGEEQTFNFNQTKEQTYSSDKIVNSNDLNLTPNHLPIAKPPQTNHNLGNIPETQLRKPSNVKTFFTQLFNMELFD